MRRCSVFCRKIICLMLTSFLLTGCCKNSKEIRWDSSEETGIDVRREEILDSDGADETESVTETENSIYVDVCGAVVSPGVYRLKQGARIFEAVQLAGGFTEEADSSLLNQAQVVTDGSRLYVYTVEEKEELMEKGLLQTENAGGQVQSEKNSVSGETKVNLNTADQEELMSLSGIGASRAGDILTYREEHGGFSAIEEIMNVSGIKESTFTKIKDKIVVE